MFSTYFPVYQVHMTVFPPVSEHTALSLPLSPHHHRHLIFTALAFIA